MARLKFPVVLFRLAAGLALFLIASPGPFAPFRAQAQGLDSTLVARFQLAESYLRGAQYDRAITLLEDLYEASPETHVFYDRLRQAYENMKRYDDALRLIDDRMQRTRAPSTLLAEKARLLYLKGDEEEALATWEAALEALPENANTYLTVYRSMMRLRLFEEAIAVLEEGRRALKRDDLFQTDLAYLYSLTGEHAKAMAEYLGLLAQNERQLSFVRSRLSRYTDQEEALRAGIAVVEQGVRRNPLNRAFRELLSWLYLEGGMYRQALNANRAIDRLEQERGQVLFTFAQQAADAGAYDVALEAYEEILARYPDAPAAPEAVRGLAEMYERRAEKSGERAFDARGNRIPAPNYDQALDAYRTFLQQYPNHPHYPDVLRRIGRLQQDVFFDLGAAEATLREVVDRYPNTDAAHRAEYDLGRIALQRNRLDAARLTFSRLADRLRTGELAELARYELALIHFYQGEFDAALTLTEAMKENTSADVANDAIALKVLLVENKGPDSLNTPLRRYAEARLLQRQRRPAEAVSTLDELLQTYGGHPLADDARFLRASILRQMGRAEDALAAFLELPLLHPQSYLADRSLFAAGELQERVFDDAEAALRTYTRILTEYPGSLLISDARARIRALRGDGA
ncbi:tetratricopeptide repeat protein [Rhodocaloribacter sp.]